MARQQKAKGGRLKRIERSLTQGLKEMSLDADIRVTQGWKKFVHVRAISPVFTELDWPQREELVWEVLESGLAEKDLKTITLLMTETPEAAAPDYEELRERHEALRLQVRESVAKYLVKQANECASAGSVAA